MKKMTAKDLQKMINEEMKLLNSMPADNNDTLNEGAGLVAMLAATAGSMVGERIGKYFSEFPELEKLLVRESANIETVHADLGVEAGRMVLISAAIKRSGLAGDLSSSDSMGSVFEESLVHSATNTGETVLSAELLNQIIKEEHEDFMNRLLYTQKSTGNNSKQVLNEIAPLLAIGLLALGSAVVAGTSAALGDEGIESRLERAIKQVGHFCTAFEDCYTKLEKSNSEFAAYINASSPGAYEELIINNASSLSSEMGQLRLNESIAKALGVDELANMIMQEWNMLNEDAAGNAVGKLFYTNSVTGPPARNALSQAQALVKTKWIAIGTTPAGEVIAAQVGNGGKVVADSAKTFSASAVAKGAKVVPSGQLASLANVASQGGSRASAMKIAGGGKFGAQTAAAGTQAAAGTTQAAAGTTKTAAAGGKVAAAGTAVKGRVAAAGTAVKTSWGAYSASASAAKGAGPATKAVFGLSSAPAGASLWGKMGGLGGGPATIVIGGLLAFAGAPDESEREAEAMAAEEGTMQTIKNMQKEVDTYTKQWKDYKTRNGSQGRQRMRTAIKTLAKS